jgi:uncharacterized protein YneF (UPF0154 family)
MKKILIIIALALVAFVCIGLFNAKKIQKLQITKTVTINGSKKEVLEMVQYLRNFPKWSPFLAQDPSQKVRIEGVDGTIGAQYHWVGNGGEDVGYQEIVKIDTTGFVGMKCLIEKPFTAQPTFEYTISENNAGVTVTQDFKLESSLSDAFLMWVFGAVKDIENTNQQGLDLLKKAVEKL